MGKASRKKRTPDDKNRTKETGSGNAVKQQTEEVSQTSAARTALLLPIVIILAVSFAAYFNTLYNEFVYDDMTQVLENSWIRDVKHLPDIFLKSVWSFRYEHTISNYYRPLMHFIYMLNYHVFGLKPWGFHLVNVLFHAGVSVLVYLLASRLLADKLASWQAGKPAPMLTSTFLSPPFIAAILFATHPIHTEVVAWVAGIPDVSCTLFYLLSFYFYLRSKEGLKRGYPVSVAMFLLACFSKESALTLPLILIGYDHFFDNNGKGSWSWSRRYLPYFIVAGVYLALRLYALGGIAPERRHEYLSTLQYIINIFPLFSQYLGKLILPIDLNAFYVFHPIASFVETKGILSIAVTAVFAVVTAMTYRKNKVVCFNLLFIVLPLLPVFYIRGLGLNTFAERYLYLPSVGFVFLLALFLTRTAGRSPKGAVVLISSLALITGLYLVGTVKRNAVWKSDYTLFEDTVKKSPDSALPRRMLGTARLDMGKPDEAVADFNKAIAIDPSDFYSYNNRGMAFYEMGRFDRAMADFDKAVALNPRCYEAYINKGRLYGETGFPEEAIGQFSKAIEIASESLAYGNRGLAYSLIGDYDRALRDVDKAIDLDEHNAEAYGTRGNIYLRTGNRELAVSDFKKACDLGNRKGCDVLKLNVK